MTISSDGELFKKCNYEALKDFIWPSDFVQSDWHKPGCPRYSGVGECDCDTNE